MGTRGPEFAGSRLKELIGPESEGIEANQVYVLDIELWHRGTRELAMASLSKRFGISYRLVDNLKEAF